MKKIIGLLILIIVLVAISGCTQQAKTPPATTAAQTAVATVVATPVETSAAPTTEVTTEVAAPVETGIVANVTAPAGNATAPAATQTVVPAVTFSKVLIVQIANNTFSPATIMVLPGTRITWINDDTTVHSIKTIGESAGKFNSGDIAPAVQWGYDFGSDEGTFQYADGYNPNVTGVVIIKKGQVLYGVAPVTSLPTSNATW
jgi:plastocyanin